MQKTDSFRPNWASSPGATIADFIADKRLSVGDLARSLGIEDDDASRLLDGDAEITEEVANKLSKAIGSTSRFWMEREARYREGLIRLKEVDNSEPNKRWLGSLPLKDMQTFGWITRNKALPTTEQCLNFFGVASLEEWTKKIEHQILSAAFRTSASFEKNPPSVAAWLRQGEIEGSAVECSLWSKTSFEAALPRLRKLTRLKTAREFFPELQRICASCGVAVVFVPTPKGCPASGAARFLSSSKAVIVLSNRYRTDDHFWFTFFHEAGHVLLHGKNALFVDGISDDKAAEEQEANEFSQKILLTEVQRQEMFALPMTYRAVIRFARHAGVSPGIVVGQLQHSGKIGRERLNRVKRAVEFD